MADVDESVHSAPTGAAARLAAHHAAEQPLKLYGAWFCPFVQRSWITLEEKRIPYQYLEVNPYKKDPAFLKLNPRGLVPVLAMPAAPCSSAALSSSLCSSSPSASPSSSSPSPSTSSSFSSPSSSASRSSHEPQQESTVDADDDDQSRRSLMESTVICEYLDDAYSDEALHGPRLLPLDPYQRARAHLWIDHIATRIVPAFYKLLQHTPDKAYTVDTARGELMGHIKILARAMDARGPWFLGAGMSLVDISLAPWAERLFLLDHYKEGGFQIPQDEQPAEGGAGPGAGAGGGASLIGGPGAWTKWRRWAQAVAERKSVRDTASDEEEYVRVYQRYADDTTNSQVGQATRQGRRLP